MSEYTKGPWEKNGVNGVHKRVSDHYAYCIATTDGDDREANARLIAAAPDLLEALKLVDENTALLGESDGVEVYRATLTGREVKYIRALIAKAEGEQP